MKLFCFPYAGGSSGIFREWQAGLSPDIEMIAVELAGRGRRIHEEHYCNVDALIDDIFPLIADDVTAGDYAFFGHSMGGMIAHELALRIEDMDLAQPRQLFFSGRGAPHIKCPDDKLFHLMSDEEFKKEVLNLGGTPPEFFEHKELLKLFLPLLKNDFRLAEEERPRESLCPLSSNITIFLGKDDDLTAEECQGWNRHTKGVCTIHYFNGGHFFLHNEMPRIGAIINQTLLEVSAMH